MGTTRLNLSDDSNLGPILRSAAPTSSAADLGAFSPKSVKNPSPSRKLQQVFEEALQREAEERAACLHVHRTQEEVQISKPKPVTLYNARGNPYVEGDPNMGYSIEDTRPRYNSCASGSFTHKPESKTTPSSPTHNPSGTTSSHLPPDSALNLGAHSKTALPPQLNRTFTLTHSNLIYLITNPG